MSLLDRLFGQKDDALSSVPDIKFGRYSDSYKENANQEDWNAALAAFEEGHYLASYRHFFAYLRDESENNVQIREEPGRLEFTLCQGSRRITGFATRKKLKAEAKIARTHALKVGFMRRLIEKNFELKYSRFALDPDEQLTIVFDTYTLDGSPYKLYHALREVALQADKQDDLLLEEFQALEPVDTAHLDDLPPAEKEVKYNFLHQQIRSVLREIDQGSLQAYQYPGGISYLLLALIYKLDYLLKPEGYTMETLERLNRLFFSSEQRNVIEKNQLLTRELGKLIERPKADFFREMYRVKSTFGITTPVSHDRVVGFVDGELHNMDWYQENGYETIALAVPNYIVGYSLFNYALPRPDRDLFHFYFQVVESQYFKDLGFPVDYYEPSTGKFNRKAIRKALDYIADANEAHFPRLHPRPNQLAFDNLPDFARSYLLMVRNLDMTKVG